MRRSRWLLVLVAVAVVGLGVLAWHRLAAPDGAEVVGEGARDGWKAIDYRGVRVDIPQEWERYDLGECEFQFEHWGPPDGGGCHSDAGVAFYYSATFDPAHGPGLRYDAPRNPRDPVWGGWVSGGGEYDVYAAGAERNVVAAVLDSVRPD